MLIVTNYVIMINTHLEVYKYLYSWKTAYTQCRMEVYSKSNYLNFMHKTQINYTIIVVCENCVFCFCTCRHFFHRTIYTYRLIFNIFL